MFILLVGPKGSGKSHIGRLLARRFGVHFFHVEPLWMAFNAECRASGNAPDIARGVRVIHPKIREALATHEHVCVETTGASPEILADLSSLAVAGASLIVRVCAPLELCLARIATRDAAHQIPMEAADIATVHRLSTAAAVRAQLTIENSGLSEDAIVSEFESILEGRS